MSSAVPRSPGLGSSPTPSVDRSVALATSMRRAQQGPSGRPSQAVGITRPGDRRVAPNRTSASRLKGGLRAGAESESRNNETGEPSRRRDRKIQRANLGQRRTLLRGAHDAKTADAGTERRTNQERVARTGPPVVGAASTRSPACEQLANYQRSGRRRSSYWLVDTGDRCGLRLRHFRRRLASARDQPEGREHLRQVPRVDDVWLSATCALRRRRHSELNAAMRRARVCGRSP